MQYYFLFDLTSSSRVVLGVIAAISKEFAVVGDVFVAPRNTLSTRSDHHIRPHARVVEDIERRHA
jgi:ABC-type uncharacterized transport system involved in gliding motility auxiliary subunit